MLQPILSWGADRLDYADQRYRSKQFGRFMSPDTSGRVLDGDPESWNQYAYTAGDPVNRLDPNGLYYIEDSDWG
jgi:RHS repeat-associated protein